MSFDNLLHERDGAVAVLTINRPQVLNALNSQVLDEVRRAVLSLKHDAGVRAVVITGAGPKAFAAGADIDELAHLGPIDAKQQSSRGQHVFDLIENMGKPVIAAINGFALGGGCELAMACSLRIAADTARLGQPEINLGLMPGYGGTQRLARLVGRGVALDLLLSGRQVTAQEALAIGLVNRVVPAADVVAESRTLAAHLSEKPAVAVQYIIESVNRGLDATLERGQFIESTLFGMLAGTDDMREGTAAFLEKRPAAFRGR
jgi:enoyl-CoA hydratase